MFINARGSKRTISTYVGKMRHILRETLELAVTALRVERNKKSYFIYVAKDFFKAIQRTQFSRFSTGNRLFGPLPARYFDP